MLRPFDIHRPATVAEASALARQLGDDGAFYAGGTELLLLMKEGLARPRALIDVKRVAGLAGIALEDGAIAIGAAVTHRALERAPEVRARCPLVASVAAHVANVRVRSAGTVGGNLAFADPHSDLATLFLAFEGEVQLASDAGTRWLPVGELIQGPYETAREPAEVLARIRLRPWPSEAAGVYLKFGVHERPTLGLAAVLVMDRATGTVAEARLAVGCVGPRPRRLAAAERRAAGATLADLREAAAGIAAAGMEVVDPIGDLHGSAEYKREMVGVFLGRALRLVIERAGGHDPAVQYPHAVVV